MGLPQSKSDTALGWSGNNGRRDDNWGWSVSAGTGGSDQGEQADMRWSAGIRPLKIELKAAVDLKPSRILVLEPILPHGRRLQTIEKNLIISVIPTLRIVFSWARTKHTQLGWKRVRHGSGWEQLLRRRPLMWRL